MNKIKKTIAILGILTVLALILSCSEESVMQPKVQNNELIGKWELCYLQLESESGMLRGSPERLDHYLTVEFLADGTFEQSEKASGNEFSYTGNYDVSGDTIFISTPQNIVQPLKYSIESDTMKWTFLEDIHGEIFEYVYEFNRID